MYLKILLTFLTAFSLSASAQTFTGRVAEESVNVTADSTATVLGWFNMFERKGLVLSYNSSDINLYEKIKMPGQRMGIDDFLDRVLYRYVYELQHTEGNKILIRIKGVKTFVLQGHVSDADTDENLGDCSIILINQQNEIFSTATDINGMFRISVPIGKYKLKTTYVGFDRYSKPITLNRNLYAEIKMTQTSIPMKEVVVKTSPLSDIINYKGSYDILSVNSSDPFSQINSLPGVSGTLVTGNFNVNGGQSDENLILLDGIPVYHSQHNNSLLSQFNGDAVQKVSFYDSFIPARYEGRLSSVTDVKIKEGGMKRHSQNINIELPSASLTLDGPIIKDKFTYMISARHSWLDFMENIFSGNPDLNRSFMDITSKLMFRVNDYTYLRALLYRSTDSFNDTIDSYKNQEVLEWISGMYSVSLDTRIAGKIYNNSMLAYSEYKNKIFAPLIDIPSPFYINEGMSKYVMKSDFITSLDRYTDLSWGIKLLHERFNLLASKDTVENNKHDVSQISSYLNTKIKISRRLNLSAAVSFVSYLPKSNPSFFSIQPRFTMRYLCDDKNVISLDFSRMEQFYHNICLGEIPIPTDLRMPSIEGFAPSSSLHGEVGWKHNEKNSMFTVSAFYKRRFNILGVRYTIESEKTRMGEFYNGRQCFELRNKDIYHRKVSALDVRHVVHLFEKS